jgi:hypothetical protein
MTGRAVEAIGAASFAGAPICQMKHRRWPPVRGGLKNDLILPVCLRCRAARMSLTCTMEVYSGYQRRMFECLVCGDTMTQWARVPD